MFMDVERATFIPILVYKLIDLSIQDKMKWLQFCYQMLKQSVMSEY